MKSEILKYKGVCFGEVLWDNLPTGRKLGGAPLNVAYHLNKLGIHTDMLSRVGADAGGRDLVDLCKDLAIPTSLMQWDTQQPTSTVEVHIDEHRDVRYEIVFPVAWDFIAFGARELAAVREADFLVFGSLSTRNQVSYDTLKTLLQVAKYKVLDVNLRAPFYSRERILALLGYANLVKMNEEELGMIATWMDLPSDWPDRQKVDALLQHFQIDEALVTYGAAGAVYHCKAGGFSYHFPAFKVEVKDTIGSGDSFLAAFVSLRCQIDLAVSAEEMLSFAAVLSGFVTQSTGACPSYDAAQINRFQWLHSLRSLDIHLG